MEDASVLAEHLRRCGEARDTFQQAYAEMLRRFDTSMQLLEAKQETCNATTSNGHAVAAAAPEPMALEALPTNGAAAVGAAGANAAGSRALNPHAQAFDPAMGEESAWSDQGSWKAQAWQSAASASSEPAGAQDPWTEPLAAADRGQPSSFTLNQPGRERPRQPGAPPTNGASQWDFLKVATGPADPAEIEQQRSSLEIAVEGEAGEDIPPIQSFEELREAIPQYVVQALRDQDIVKPMAIQCQALPVALRGFDMIGIAKTGSGKTLAFLLAAFAHIEAQQVTVQGTAATPTALALAPVRELAVQIAEEANKLLKHSKSEMHPRGVGAVALYGGGQRVRWEQQSLLQKGWTELVVATPGRVCDFLEGQELNLSQASFMVLDEADRMLEEGLGDQLDKIEAAATRVDRQTLFFSATWPLRVRELATQMCRGKSPVRIMVGQQEDAGSGPVARHDIIQEVVVFSSKGKHWRDVAEAKRQRLDAHLRELLATTEHKVLVFVGSKNLTWELSEQLNKEGFSSDFMYGGRSQDQRHEVLRKFKEGSTRLLVTTDVMARGLDIPGVSHVVVYDCYGDIEEYVHRIGRTARGPYGKGHALTFYEFHPKYAEFPAELIKLLEECHQTVPDELRTSAEEAPAAAAPWRSKKQAWQQQAWQEPAAAEWQEPAAAAEPAAAEASWGQAASPAWQEQPSDAAQSAAIAWQPAEAAPPAPDWQ